MIRASSDFRPCRWSQRLPTRQHFQAFHDGLLCTVREEKAGRRCASRNAAGGFLQKILWMSMYARRKISSTQRPMARGLSRIARKAARRRSGFGRLVVTLTLQPSDTLSQTGCPTGGQDQAGSAAQIPCWAGGVIAAPSATPAVPWKAPGPSIRRGRGARRDMQAAQLRGQSNSARQLGPRLNHVFGPRHKERLRAEGPRHGGILRGPGLFLPPGSARHSAGAYTGWLHEAGSAAPLDRTSFRF